MELIHYPLLCWEISKGYVCGQLLGTPYQLVSRNVKKIKNLLAEQLVRDIEKWGDTPPALRHPLLKNLLIEVRPSYKEKDGVYPVASPVKIPVTAVYGENEFGFFECFLPLLDERFYFYDLEQAQTLIEHFAKNRFQELKPDEVYHYLLPPEPWLDTVPVRVPPGAEWSAKERDDWLAATKNLAKVADRFPYSKSMRTKNKIFPEAAWEQGEKIQAVVEKITREQANLLLVGPHGVGKSAIISEAVTKIHHLSKSQTTDRMPRFFWKTSAHKLIAGTRYLGEWQEVCETVMDELAATHGVLWVTGFTSLIYMGGEGVEDSMAAFILPYLQSGQVQIISEVTPQELDAARSLMPKFSQNFQTLTIEEMPEKKVWKVLDHFRGYSQEKLGVSLDKRATQLSYRLLTRFIKYESFPGKAVTFLSKCLNDAMLRGQKEIGEGEIIAAFAEQTGLSEIFLRDDLLLNSQELAAFFAKRIIGQPDAIAKMASVVKVFKAGLNNPGKPIATMIFAGPTGIGKTASVRALSDFFFSKGQKQNPLIRLDMSEFQHPYQIARLIGSSETEPGKLVREVRERPFSVLLLDEIEKAHPAIFDALLTVLDEGILCDRYGRLTDFRNCIIIMTTNLGVGHKSLGFGSAPHAEFSHQLQSFFRPEFFNRLDTIVTFRPLSSETIQQITRKELNELSRREGFAKRALRLDFSDELVTFLAKEGFDERYGARPLQRTIERCVVAALAKFLLQNNTICGTIVHIGIHTTTGSVTVVAD